jgi:hypothetical protein
MNCVDMSTGASAYSCRFLFRAGIARRERLAEFPALIALASVPVLAESSDIFSASGAKHG